MNTMNPYQNEKTICVGGPCHGRFVHTEKPDYLEVVLRPWRNTDVWKDAIDSPTQVQAFLRTKYKLECVRAQLGSLFLEGWVFGWYEMEKDDLLRSAFGLMLSECVCDFRIK